MSFTTISMCRVSVCVRLGTETIVQQLEVRGGEAYSQVVRIET